MSNITPIRTSAEAALLARFPEIRASLPGTAEVDAAREAAFRSFAEQGLPHRRVEAWKYTDLRALMREAAPLAGRPDQATVVEALRGGSAPLADIGPAVTVSFVNGHHVGMAGELPAGVSLVPLAQALAEGHPLVAKLGALELARGDLALGLNAAFMTDGAIIEVDAGVTVESPILLDFVTASASAVATATRVLLVAGEGASVTIVESHSGHGDAAHQANGVLEIVAGARSTVQHVRVAQNGAGTLALSALTADLAAEADLTSLNLALSGAVARHQVYARVSGEDAKAQINGAALLHGRQHADSTLVVQHAATGGLSRELFRTILDDESVGVFQGKIIVDAVAQKTDGKMASNAILLAEGAAMNHKPELEIFADDVACGHGATCGALDEDLLFYLRARGIPKPEAEALMIESFVGEAIEFIAHEATREALLGLVENWLGERAGRLAGAAS